MINQKYFDNLNESQKKAVEYIEGPLLVLAGAGTGKTKVLTSRIAHIIRSAKAYPNQILAVTFTNKAAREMQERVSDIVDSSGIWLGTFHSIAAKILRKNANLINLSSDFNIIDYDDQLKIVKNILRSYGYEEKQISAKQVLSQIQRWKDHGIYYNKLNESDLANRISEIAKKVYKNYQERLVGSASVDFGDLLLYNTQIFIENYDVLEFYQKKFKYMLVDEYQDTNISQYVWLRMIAGGHKNICCVGDEDQSIYGWRGAEIGNILRFEKDFPGAKIIRLEQNYRSTSNILSVASKIINNNKMRLGKNLWTDVSSNNKVKVISCTNDIAEVRFIANEIISLKHNKNITNNQIAVLIRASFQSRAFEEGFMSFGLKYNVVGGLKFYERTEIKDVIAYVRVSLIPDNDIALERIINVPRRMIGDQTVQELKQYALKNNLSLFRAIGEVVEKKLMNSRRISSLKKLREQILSWHNMFNEKNHVEAVDKILKDSGYINMWKNTKTIESETKLENIEELQRAMCEYKDITNFLEHVSLISDLEQNDNNDNSLTIMTLHAAKGLEFNTVFLPGWEEGIFPHQKALEENGDKGLEEERRLAYVGITRARENLYILHSSFRRMYNQFHDQNPSRFIMELPEHSTELIRC